MKYGDEEIVELLNKYKKGVYGDIYSGFYIKEDLYHFGERLLFKGQVSVYLPIRFNSMSEDEIREKYKLVIPELVYRNNQDTIQIMFDCIDEEYATEEVNNTIDILEKYIKKLNKGNKIIEKGIVENENNTIGWIDFMTLSDKSSFYINYFTLSVNNKNVNGKFVCEYANSSLWKPIFLEILKSIKIKESEDGTR